MCDYRNFNIKQRCLYGLAEKVLVAVVIWVSDQGNTSRQKLWASGLDENLAIWAVKTNLVICPRLFAIL
jgi:hypothetical protein